LPIHLLLSRLRRVAAAVLLAPLAALAQDPGLPDGLYAEITTPRGVITCQLEFEKAPLTVTSFVGLAEGTLGPAPRRPFFNGLTFHRVVPGFVIQGGDPKGTGEGGPGYTFPDEFGRGLSHDSVGVLSMANDGPDTNGSQFFITLTPKGRLDYLYSIFGHTVRGRDVLPKVVQGDKMTVRILRNGPAARAFRADEASFAALVAKTPAYGTERKPGPTTHFDDPAKVLPETPPIALFDLYKLNNVERATGLRIYVRLLDQSAPAPGAGGPDGVARGLAQSLGMGQGSVLAVYRGRSDTWGFWFGSSAVARFTGTADGSGLDEAERAFLVDARKRAAKSAAEIAPPLPKMLQDPAQNARQSVGAVVSGLIDRYFPH
jgi:cyclophilin family peptidyl-prolyl cis-trans isomerase